MYSTAEKFYLPRTIPQSKLLDETPSLNLKWETTKYTNTADPSVWGPALWFSMHNGALRYPINASPVVASRMKGFILGLPEIIPCIDCKEHARSHVESTDLNSVTSGRKALFCFFVSFHNFVNKRYGKPSMSCEKAMDMYTGDAKVTYLKY
jgi:hypothetical protein